MPIKIIDLFAGPGGLGEGFSAFKKNGEHPFKICVSIEKEDSAHKTLTLRSFYRQYPTGKAPDAYYEYISGRLGTNPEDTLYKQKECRKQAAHAHEEAQKLTLGENNRTINHAIGNALGKRPGPWVLIGGPPCQAYSIAGRSRNKGIKGYKAEKDHRSYLYREYLKVISKFKPAVFVMENVRGMISAKLDGEYIFPNIIDDLRCPKKTLGTNDTNTEYEIFSFVKKPEYDLVGDSTLSPTDFLICSEDYSIPQKRHRVILLGIRKDHLSKYNGQILKQSTGPTLKNLILDMPKLRSGLSREADELDNWINSITQDIKPLIQDIRGSGLPKVATCMRNSIAKIKKSQLTRGSRWEINKRVDFSKKLPQKLIKWFKDPSGWQGVCNHETRSHIQKDLHRYLFSACYGNASGGETPKTRHFPESLYADHANWDSGHFADRFRVQNANKIATTVTSHISKDGHYYIHYDPTQCRSLTVREAARIQTFPDNYFFVGNRTQQYVQVGNAVPPYLANQIADIVYAIIS